MMTFQEWMDRIDFNLRGELTGRILEDGYAFYLEEQLERPVTVQEVKDIGKIDLLTSE